MIAEFPPVDLADEKTGLLAYGGDLQVASLELAYRSGIFPWPSDPDEPILWFAPPRRAILAFDKLHVPRRLRRLLNQGRFEFRVDHDFESVIRNCATTLNRKKQLGTWITADVIRAFCDFQAAGFVHSFESYNSSGQLAGGMYGVLIDNYFAGESMFFHEAGASKVALINAIGYLEHRGLTWMDIQMLTPLLTSLGAEEIPREQFMQKLRKALSGAP